MRGFEGDVSASETSPFLLVLSIVARNLKKAAKRSLKARMRKYYHSRFPLKILSSEKRKSALEKRWDSPPT